VTGRGHADEYQRNLDSAYVFKTDSPGVKGGVVTNAVDFFLGTNGIWERLKQENSRNFSKKEPPPTSFSHRLGSWFHYWSNPIAKMSTPKQIQEYWDTREARTGLLSTTPAQLNELQSLKDWAENPQTTSGEILKAQIVHNDFMNQMCRRLPRPADCPIDERKTFIKDSILKKSIALIDQAKSTVRLYTFATILSEGLKDSLIAAAQRGVDVQVFTNGKEAHAEAISDGIYNWVSTLFYVPFGPSVAVGWYAGLDVMSDLLNAGVKIHALKITDEYNFLHRKRLQVDDIVSFGSSNLTEASTTMQWEMNIFVQGDFVANWAEADFQSDILTYALPLDPEEIQIERNQTGMEQSLARKFSFIY
jgi:phosphatidylserine/phosphatidylglycerophosphate/cardiolipin synthase-like enzyme